MVELDSPWKESLDVYFQSFLALCFPAVHREIDWTRGYEMLDKELPKFFPEAAAGLRVVDKLVRVWRNTGDEEWILVHVEVQSQALPDFPERVFVYHYRLRERYNKKVVSLVVLGDDRAGWRPDCYRDELWGCEIEFRFPTVKLLDYTADLAKLEGSTNPFAVLVLAHLRSMETKGDLARRYDGKFHLAKGLYEKGWDKDRIRRLFRFVDWMMDLPPELEQQFKQELFEFEEEKQMPYVTSVERLAREEGRQEGREEGREEGLREGIASVLEVRFGAEAASIMADCAAVDGGGS